MLLLVKIPNLQKAHEGFLIRPIPEHFIVCWNSLQTLPPEMNHCFFLFDPASCCKLHSNASCVGLASNQKAAATLRRIPKGTLHPHLQIGCFTAWATLVFELPVLAYDVKSSRLAFVVWTVCRECSRSKVKSTNAGPASWVELTELILPSSELESALTPISEDSSAEFLGRRRQWE